MKNLMVLFILSVSDWKYPFWANLIEKFKFVCYSRKLVASLIRICNSVVLFAFSVFDRKHLFWPKLSTKKIKIASLTWNFAPTIIQKIFEITSYKIAHYSKSLNSVFKEFLNSVLNLLSAKFSFWQGDWALGYYCIKF